MRWEERPERSVPPPQVPASRPGASVTDPDPWPELAVDVLGIPAQLTKLRAEARRWLETVEVPADLALDVLIALSEAATNAVLHAYPAGSPGRIRVQGRRRGDEIELVVEDDGSWRDRSAHHDGRGLAIIDALSTSAEVARGTAGSRVAFRRAIPTGSSGVPPPGGRAPDLDEADEAHADGSGSGSGS